VKVKGGGVAGAGDQEFRNISFKPLGGE